MENQTSENKNRTLAGIIVFLLFVLILETGLLLFQIRKTSLPQKEAAIQHEPFAAPVSRLHRGPNSGQAAHPAGTRQNTSFADQMRALERIQERMNRLFDTALLYGPPIAKSLMTGGVEFTPAVDIQDDGKNYIVRSDLPGLEKDKINVTVNGNMLTIEGVRETQSEKKDSQQGFYSQERSYGSFSRSVPLPGPVDESKINADYKNGVLTVLMPKAEKSKTAQKVPVQ